jgi:NAD+ synthase
MQATPDNDLHPDVLHIDCEAASGAICRQLVEIVAKDLRRRGVVVALSGGVDSSVCAALAVKALGANKVFGLLLPEADSSSMSKDLGRRMAESLGIQYLVQNITQTLTAIGCYKWRDEAIRSVFPNYKEDWKSKLVIAGGADGRFNFFNLVVQSPDGAIHERRLQYKEYLQIVAATNFKQRIRKTMEYFHADRLHYAVVGTPNRLEYDQGFFVKNGDGSADIKPIVHLYKTQVYALARYFKLPPEIYNAKPTTDTYSLPQGQDEFYFTLPYHQMDLALWAYHRKLPARTLAAALNIEEARAGFIYRDIEAKRRAARYLHARPMLIEEVASP